MSTLKKYESLKGKRKLPRGRTTKVPFPVDSLLKTDALAGSLLVVDLMERVYMDDLLPNFLVL
jgi:hypothetical protein